LILDRVVLEGRHGFREGAAVGTDDVGSGVGKGVGSVDGIGVVGLLVGTGVGVVVVGE
jgi:hypothetical protein